MTRRVERRRLRPEDHQEAARLPTRSSRLRVPKRYTDLWEWKFSRTLSMDPSPFWVLATDEKVVGICPTIPATAWIDEKEHEMLWGVDIFMDEEEKGLGVHMLALMREWQKAAPITMGMGVSGDGYRAQKGLGWTDIRWPRVWIKPLSSKGMLGHVWEPLRLLWPVGDLAIKAWRGMHGRTRLTVEAVGEIDERFDTFWKRIRKSLSFCVVRDASYLRWRFEKHPLRNYNGLCTYDQHGLTGYAFGHVGGHPDFPRISIGFVSDILAVDDAVAKSLLLGLEDRLEEDGADMLVALAGDAKGGKYLRKAGFVPTTRTLPTIVHCQDQSLHERLSGASMYQTLSDSDGDML